MSTQNSDSEAPNIPPQTQPPGSPRAYPAQYPQTVYPAQPPPRRPLSQRPLAIVLIIAGGLVAVAFLLFVVLSIFFGIFSAVRPLSQVMLDDFATAGDAPMVVGEALSWDQSNGTLNLYPTEPGRTIMEFEFLRGGSLLRVDADFASTSAPSDPGFAWGITAYNSATREGVALMCDNRGTMFLAAAATGDPLPGAASTYPCQESMSMSLEIRDSSVMWGQRAADHALYIGNVNYTNLDAVGVVVESTQPDQVLRVSKIEAYQ